MAQALLVTSLAGAAIQSTTLNSGNDSPSLSDFAEILRFRSLPDPKAVPALEQALMRDLHSTRIHGYAAAQALFNIGTPEAHAVLSRLLLTNWPAMRDLADAPPLWTRGLAVMYTSSWNGMSEPQRSRFIAQYLLKNLATNLALELDCKLVARKQAVRAEFKFTFRNTGKASYQIPEFDDWCLGRLLFVRDPMGTFLPYQIPGGGDNAIEMVELQPGAAKEFTLFQMIGMGNADEDRRRGLNVPADAVFMAEFAGDHYLVAGEYEVTAMFEVERRPDWRKSLEGQSAEVKERQRATWAGRVASKPLKLKFPLPAAAPEQK
jgi:hypothetical protein